MIIGLPTVLSGLTALLKVISPIRRKVVSMSTHVLQKPGGMTSSRPKLVSGAKRFFRLILRMIVRGFFRPIGSYWLITSPNTVRFVRIMLGNLWMSSSVRSHSSLSFRVWKVDLDLENEDVFRWLPAVSQYLLAYEFYSFHSLAPLATIKLRFRPTSPKICAILPS